MGGCVSTSSSTCSSKSNGEKVSPECLGISMFSRKRIRRTFSDHAIALKHLSSIPNRIFTNGKSRTSCIYTQQGRKGINQDAMIVWEDFMAEDVTFCGVFDGHGPHGHLVARKVRDALPLKLRSFLQSFESKANLELEVVDPDKDQVNADIVDNQWKEAFLQSYKAMDKELRSQPNLDCFCSGSTSVSLVKQGSNLYMGYIGDSRAILASKDDKDSMVAVQLTVDLKPDLPKEAERIKQCKGRVFALQDEPEVHRVWLPFDNAPGLAMARAFGDFCVKDYGVISVPEFSHRVLTERDKFIVLASDGVWDVLSNEEVVDIVSSAPTRSSASRILVDSAAREWKIKYPTSKMDDCAVVCLFLDGKMNLESDNEEEQCLSSTALQRNHSDIAAESDDAHSSEPFLQRNTTVRSAEENDVYKRVVAEAEAEADQETAITEDQKWSGLEGVTRVNSLVQLPRFSDERQGP